MKDLAINRHLDNNTRQRDILVNGVVYSLHITNNEVIITENSDYSVIYQVTSLEFWNAMH